jgi:hypothetical protein
LKDVATVDEEARGQVTILGDLAAGQLDLRGETPLFAAGRQFAEEVSGPIARAFLKLLPEEWRRGHLVIDSMLVWLGLEFRQGERFWCHEPFPGRSDGAGGQSNIERHAEHIACCCGPAGIDFLNGDAAGTELLDTPQRMDAVRDRHNRLERAIGERRLLIESVAPWTIYRYRWGAFHRHQVATTSGFQFWIRATRGDNRPLVNGIRNATNL